MNDAMLKSLLTRIKALEDAMPRMRRGVVTNASPLEVALGASDVPYENCKHLASYTPTIDDQVQVVLWGYDLIVLGEIA